MASVSEFWLEWKDRCASGLCSEAARSALCAFADSRFRGYVNKYFERGTGGGRGFAEIGPADAWHLFETHLLVRNTRCGKRYKEWLFDRVNAPAAAVRPAEGDWLDTVQGGATLIMRDVVREYLRREHSPDWTVSLNSPISDGDTPLTLEDLLPGSLDPAGEVAQREFERLAALHAARFAAEMNRRERVALLARGEGIPLTHPAVEFAAGCRKSTLNEALHGFVARVVRQLRAHYGGEDPSALRLLAVMILGKTQDEVAAWAKDPENRCAHLFQTVGGGYGRTS
jgi:hypothetical protein